MNSSCFRLASLVVALIFIRCRYVFLRDSLSPTTVDSWPTARSRSGLDGSLETCCCAFESVSIDVVRRCVVIHAQSVDSETTRI